MKSTELFDLLGEIDDKFYEEARIPDELHGDEIVSEHRPFSGFMSIFLPIAACVAMIVAVGFGANFVKRNAGIVIPNTFDSDSSAENSISSEVVSSDDVNSSSSSEDSSVPVQNDREIRLEDYPPIDFDTVPDMEGGPFETQLTQQDKKLQKATLETLQCGEYTLYMLGEYLYTDKTNEPDILYSYNVKLALAKDGKVISTDGTHTTSVSMGQGGYRLYLGNLIYTADTGNNTCLEYYELNGGNLVIFKYETPGIAGWECTFFTITDDGELRLLMGDLSGIGGAAMDVETYLLPGYIVDSEANTLTMEDDVYTFNVENFALNPYEAAHYTASSEYRFPDLSKYPFVDISEIPDVGNDPNDTTNALPKATIAEKQVGDYTLSLIGENVRTSLLVQKDDDLRFMADGVCSVISRDGNVIRVTGENGTGVRTLMLTEQEAYDLLPDAYELKDGIVFGLDKKSVQPSGMPSFGKVDVYDFDKEVFYNMSEFTADYYTLFIDNDNDPYMGEVPMGNGDNEMTVVPEENALIRGNEKFNFDFGNLRVTLSQVGVDMTESIEQSLPLYKEFDADAINTVQERVVFDVKECGEYKFYLLGHGAVAKETEIMTSPMVDYAVLYIAVEKGGKIVDCIAADNRSHLLHWVYISDYIKPFEMKDGIGFVMAYIIEPRGRDENVSMIYKIENDKVTKLKYDMDFAPAPATGSPQCVGDFEVDFENNALVDYYGTLTIDFNNNTFSRS
ncbi:MAG: hypothetical protein HDT43_02005 [Ruminococcaceae bacterium]|nr:hypothetical protein [Oscillospiraceae bacterium]